MAKILIQIMSGFNPEEVERAIMNNPFLGLDLRKSKEYGYLFETELDYENSDDYRAIKGIIEEQIKGVRLVECKGYFRY